MPIKQIKYKKPEAISGKQCASYLKNQKILGAIDECERCNKAAQVAYDRMNALISTITAYAWKVLHRLSEQMRKERGVQT